MNRDEVIEQARAVGWRVEPCANPEYIAIRSFMSDTNEAMRVGSNGEVYVRGDDGWMYQVGTIDDVAQAIRERGQND